MTDYMRRQQSERCNGDFTNTKTRLGAIPGGFFRLAARAIKSRNAFP